MAYSASLTAQYFLGITVGVIANSFSQHYPTQNVGFVLAAVSISLLRGMEKELRTQGNTSAANFMSHTRHFTFSWGLTMYLMPSSHSGEVLESTHPSFSSKYCKIIESF